MLDGETTVSSGGIGGSIRRLLESATGFLGSKFELISVEFHEEKRRIVELLILAAAAMLFAVLALTLLTFSIVAYFWETHRMAAIFGVCGVYSLIAILLFNRLRRQAHLKTKVFEATVEEFKNDTEWIRRHL